jgi:hypothetical protein
LTFQFPISLPNRADQTLLPGILTGVLVLTLVAQIMWLNPEPQLPPAMTVTAARFNFATPTAVQVPVSRAIFDRPLFAPRQSAVTAQNSGAPVLPLGGAVVAGTVTVRGRTFAVVRRPNRTTRNMAIGSELDGWRLASFGQQSAVFAKGRERREITFGALPGQATAEPAAE